MSASVGVFGATGYTGREAVRLLRQQLDLPAVEIDSVDGFQGREKEAVVISLVRSNQLGEIGFLSDVRRMNVAMTRARRLLLIVGDSATLSSDPFYQRLFEYVEQIGAYRTVWEENWSPGSPPNRGAHRRRRLES